MRRITILLVITLTFFTVRSFGQKNEDLNDYIIFEYHHSMRIPYSDVVIKIQNGKNGAIVTVRSKAANDEKKWDYSNISKHYVIDQRRFENIQSKVKKLNAINLPKNQNGRDGFTCSIDFSGNGAQFSHTVWSPTYQEKTSDLNYFLDLCYEIIRLGNLNPNKVFETKNKKG